MAEPWLQILKDLQINKYKLYVILEHSYKIVYVIDR